MPLLHRVRLALQYEAKKMKHDFSGVSCNIEVHGQELRFRLS